MQLVRIAFTCGCLIGGICRISLMCLLAMSCQNEPFPIESKEVDMTITSSTTDASFIDKTRMFMTDLNMPIELRKYPFTPIIHKTCDNGLPVMTGRKEQSYGTNKI